MFEFSHQPLKAVFLIYSTVTILFIRIPYWIILSSIPRWRQKRSWSLSRSFRMRFLNAALEVIAVVGWGIDGADPEVNAKSAENLKLGFVYVDGISEEFVRGEVGDMAKTNNVTPARVSGYWYGRRGSDGKHAQQASPGEKVLFYMHGEHDVHCTHHLLRFIIYLGGGHIVREPTPNFS
jgi:hypothetical protein